MELKDIVAQSYRPSGLSCHNCTHLGCEYDLDADRSGVWTCEKLPEFSKSDSFPFNHPMPCFELSFWFSIFAQDLHENTSDYEAALDKFTRSLAQVKGAPVTLKTGMFPGSSESMQMG